MTDLGHLDAKRMLMRFLEIFGYCFFKEMIGLFEVEFNYFLEIECRDESMIQLRDAFVEELVYGLSRK